MNSFTLGGIREVDFGRAPKYCTKAGKRETYTGTSPPLFSKKAMQWGKKWPVQMNLPFFAVEAYVPGGVQNQAEKMRKNAFRPVPVHKFTFPEKGVRAIDARNSQLENGSNAAKPSVRAPGCQQMSVNTLLCDALGLAENFLVWREGETFCTHKHMRAHTHTHTHIPKWKHKLHKIWNCLCTLSSLFLGGPEGNKQKEFQQSVLICMSGCFGGFLSEWSRRAGLRREGFHFPLATRRSVVAARSPQVGVWTTFDVSQKTRADWAIKTCFYKIPKQQHEPRFRNFKHFPFSLEKP